jgi:hypothetical protein
MKKFLLCRRDIRRPVSVLIEDLARSGVLEGFIPVDASCIRNIFGK